MNCTEILFPLQLCHVSHFTPELYVNFDCGLYCSNVFERLTKMLSKVCYVANVHERTSLPQSTRLAVSLELPTSVQGVCFGSARPHQLRWGDQEMGTAICSRTASTAN